MHGTFNILSLSGGGIKGIFQATFLKCLEQEYQVPLYQMFDLVAGTSTGSIVGAALACGLQLENIAQLYRDKGNEIFNKKSIPIIRTSWYSNKFLKSSLQETFQNLKMNNSKIKIIIPTTSLENGKHKIFTEQDKVSIVDALMSSAAAPFYFEAYKIHDNDSHSYLDGGLWANDPTLLAILYAIYILDVPIGRIRVLSLGTACMPQCEEAEKMNTLRTFNPGKIKKVFNTIFNSSENFSHVYSENLLSESAYLHLSPTDQAVTEISIDGVDKAISTLPAFADDLFKKHKNQLLKMLGYEGRTPCILKRSCFIKEEAILNTGLADFIPTRNFYRQSDKDRDLKSYLRSAQRTIRLISVSLSNAIQYHGLIEILEQLMRNNSSLKISISLLDFEKDYLIEVMAPILDKSKEELKNEIKTSIIKLSKTKYFKRINLLLHDTIPFGTIIMLDEEDFLGSVIIETKPIGASVVDSFSYKLLNNKESVLFNNILKGCEQIDKKSRKITKSIIRKWQN